MRQKDKLKKAKRLIRSMRGGSFNCYCGIAYGVIEKLKAEKNPDENGDCWYTHSKRCAQIQEFVKGLP